MWPDRVSNPGALAQTRYRLRCAARQREYRFGQFENFFPFDLDQIILCKTNTAIILYTTDPPFKAFKVTLLHQDTSTDRPRWIAS